MPNIGTLTGLTAGTSYVLDAVHVDAWGNVSAVASSAAFTTDAATTPPNSFADDFSGFTSGDDPATGPYSYVGDDTGAASATVAINASGNALIVDATGSAERAHLVYDTLTFTGAHKASTTIADFGGANAFEANSGPLIAYTDADNYVRAWGRSDGRITLEVRVGGVLVDDTFEYPSAAMNPGDVLSVEIDGSGDITVRVDDFAIPGLTAYTPASAVPVTAVKAGMSWRLTAGWATSPELSSFSCEAP